MRDHLTQNHTARIDESEKAQSLIQAGITLFGDYGLNGTTTRMLSEHAEANAAAIPYYFGSKQGLYLATMSYIVDQILAKTSPFMDQVEASLTEGLTPEEALHCYEQMIEGFCALFIDDDELTCWSNLIMREHVAPTEAYVLFYEGYYARIQRIMAELIALATGKDPRSDEVMIQSHALFGQVLGFLVARETLKRGLSGGAIEPQHHVMMKQIIRYHIHQSLRVPL